MTVTAILLGNAQDAGLPQAGCGCANCEAAWADPSLARPATCLGLVDFGRQQSFLIDATPDFKTQFRQLSRHAPLAGVLITHAHIGHYTGLIHLGYEAMNARRLPLYGTPRLLDFLRTHAPWRQLVEMANLELIALTPEQPLALTPSLTLTPLLVPHRDEWSDTLGFSVQGPRRSLLYIPDINRWQDWEREIRQEVARVEVALLDGCFYDENELPGRELSQIGHPLAVDTARRLAGCQQEVRLIHLNHTNPLHRDGPERKWLAAQGAGVGMPGDRWQL